jgi:hypothetical protein
MIEGSVPVKRYAPRDETIDGPASRLTLKYLQDGRERYQLEADYVVFADRVNPQDISKHLEAVTEMRSSAGVQLPMDVLTGVGPKRGSRNVNLVISGALLLLVTAVWLKVPQRLHRWLSRPRKRRTALATETGVVVVVTSSEQMRAIVREQSCTCGGHFLQMNDVAQAARTDGLAQQRGGAQTVRLMCAHCSEPRILSFDLRPN